jgi:hypothetical protein
MQFNMEQFARVKKFIGSTAIDASADTITIEKGANVTFVNLTGNIWINFTGTTAVADATAFKLLATNTIKFAADGNISIISDGSGGTYEYIIWRL